MKLHLHTPEGANAISGHGEGYVAVNGARVEHAVIVMADRLIDPWPVAAPLAPTLQEFAVLLELQPELIVFGSGARFKFPTPAVMARFSQAGIGFEAMDTPAACRTYNVLMSEGRRVAAALLV
ncbi:MAG: Mth938-like domain-containing protein [Betaproteobacteria bacterium]|nr:Mth938-like domain-containing protein [Betaproteobacteria bacterium]